MGGKDRAKVFWTGRSQAVRLPKEFRFDVDEVSIRKAGRMVILEPVEKPGWPSGFWEAYDGLPPVPDDFGLPGRPSAAGTSGYRDDAVEGWVQDRDDP